MIPLPLLLTLAQQAPFCTQLFPPAPAPVVRQGRARPSPRVCRIAVETDYQFFQLFGDAAEAREYALDLLGAVSEQLWRDVQTRLDVVYLGIHASPNDGWTSQEHPGSGPADLLYEFQNKWGPSWSWPVPADLAHFLSGDSLGGGVAYVGALCNPYYGFGVSANLHGLIDWSTWDFQAGSLNWDYFVVAHELGHNFGSLHTHDYCPPLDRCATNCTGARSCTRGTLMSYCHQCGGVANVDTWYHPVTARIMRENVDGSCLERILR